MRKIVLVEPKSTHLHVYSRVAIPRLGVVLLGTILRFGRADQAEAGIVDDELRLETVAGKSLIDIVAGIGPLQIERQNQRTRISGRSQLVGQRLQPPGAARDQHQRMSVTRKDHRQLAADAGRRAGDDGNGSPHGPPVRAGNGRPSPLLSAAATARRSSSRSRCDMPSRSEARHMTLSSNSFMRPSA